MLLRQIGRVTMGAWMNDTFDLSRLEHASCGVASGLDAAMLETLKGVLACKACGYRADSPLSGYLADSFDLRHLQWGSRGDPHVWGKLRTRLSDVATPREVLGVLLGAFEAVTGVDL